MVKYVVARHLDNGSNIIKEYLLQNKLEDRLIQIWNGSSMFEKYNTAILGWMFDNESPLSDDDIICFIHEDVKILDESFEEKVEYIFKHRQSVGVIGVIGTVKYSDIGGWWHVPPEFQYGSIVQSNPDSVPYKMVKNVKYTENAVSVDGCCFFVRGKVAKEIKFDDERYSGYHFYDSDYCLTVLENNYKIAIADILVEHLSPGPIDNSWMSNRKIFFDKWTSKGYKFPITANSFKK